MSFDRQFVFGSPVTSTGSSYSDSDEEKEPLLSNPDKRYIPKKYFTRHFATIDETEDEKSPTSPKKLTTGGPSVTWYRRLGVGTTAATVMAFLMLMVSKMTFTISLPMYLAAMTRGGSDVYIGITMAVMWFPVVFLLLWLLTKAFLIRDMHILPRVPWMKLVAGGVTLACGLLLLSLCAHPSRTHTLLQPILQTLLLPVAVFTRAGMRKFSGLVSDTTQRQHVALVVQLAGVFVALWPLMFDFAGSLNPYILPWYFTLIYVVACAIITVSVTQLSRMQVKYQDRSLTLMLWVSIIVFITCALLFGVDFIPGLGMADSWTSMGHYLAEGFFCFYQTEPACQGPSLLPRAIALIISANLVPFAVLLLMVLPRAPIYLTSSLVLSTLLATVYWTLFHDWPEFEFQPRFNRMSTVFIIAGLALSMLAILTFIYYSLEECEKRERCERLTSAPVRIGRKELFPAMSRVRRATYTAGEIIPKSGLLSLPTSTLTLPPQRSLGRSGRVSAVSVAKASRAKRSSLPQAIPAPKTLNMRRVRSSPHMISI